MSTPHSLPFSNGSSSQHTVNTKRHSQPSQLPLPSSLSAPVPQRPHGVNTILKPGNLSVNVPGSPPPHPKSPSAVSIRSRGEPPLSSPPSIAAFPPPQPIHSSSTHAGGIQPSASFFRPSRPSQQYSRPQSASSANNGDPIRTADPDLFQLTPLPPQRLSSSSDEGPSGSTGGGQESTVEEENRQLSSLQRLKQSREPLLPFGGRPAPLAPRPSVSRERNAAPSSTTLTARETTSRLVRSSIDRVLGLRQGLSFESMRRSPTAHPPPAHDRHPTFEGKRIDEEHGMYPPSISPTSRYKNSSPHGNQSLNVTALRHSPINTTSPSPDHSFMPTPPNRGPPLSAIPIINPQTGKPVRNYQLHGSRNKFFFGGRLLTGGDSPWAFVASLLLLFAIAGVWFATTCVWWWHNESPAVAVVGGYLALITITTMLATVSRSFESY